MVEVYIERASGRSPVEYDHPLLEPILKPTFGVIVFQEQIMHLSVALAGYTKGGSDNLRKIVGKKIMAKMPAEKEKFTKGCMNNESFTSVVDNPASIVEKIWKQIETFGRLAEISTV